MSRQSLLIVDDEKLICKAVKVNLESSGFEVGTAESAESALTALKERPYDLLLTDYLMEEVNGVELMLQARELYPEIKVIVSSGFVEEVVVEEILRLGADGFLRKPFNLTDLLERISEVMAA